MTLKSILATLLCLGNFYTITHAATMPSPVGYWFTGIDDEKKKRLAKIEIYPCGNKFCGKIASLANPLDPKTNRVKLDVHNPDENKRDKPLIGLEIVKGMTPDKSEPNKWVDGEIYDAKKGDIYSAQMTMPDENNLHLRGYILGMPFLGKTQEWVRTTKDSTFD